MGQPEFDNLIEFRHRSETDQNAPKSDATPGQEDNTLREVSRCIPTDGEISREAKHLMELSKRGLNMLTNDNRRGLTVDDIYDFNPMTTGGFVSKDRKEEPVADSSKIVSIQSRIR